MQIVRVLLVAVLLAAAAAPTPGRAQIAPDVKRGTRTFALLSESASGAGGRVTLNARDAYHTAVMVSATGTNAPAFAELRVGKCAATGSHRFAQLSGLAAGTSTTVVPFSFAKLAGGSFSIRIQTPSGPVACANLGHSRVPRLRLGN
jgi:hypothetical protein